MAEYLDKFIVFEGIDGCGKTTQVKKFVERLEQENHVVVSTAEPTNIGVGKFLREEILSGKTKLDVKTVVRLFAADREEHLNYICMNNENYTHTVCDRYIASNIAYQGLESEELANFTIKQNEDFERPWVTVYLRVDPKEVPKVFERVCKRGETKEIFDKVELQQKLAKRFDDILCKDEVYLNTGESISENIITVSALGSEDEIADRIWKAFKEIEENKND